MMKCWTCHRVIVTHGDKPPVTVTVTTVVKRVGICLYCRAEYEIEIRQRPIEEKPS